MGGSYKVLFLIIHLRLTTIPRVFFVFGRQKIQLFSVAYFFFLHLLCFLFFCLTFINFFLIALFCDRSQTKQKTFFIFFYNNAIYKITKNRLVEFALGFSKVKREFDSQTLVLSWKLKKIRPFNFEIDNRKTKGMGGAAPPMCNKSSLNEELRGGRGNTLLLF